MRQGSLSLWTNNLWQIADVVLIFTRSALLQLHHPIEMNIYYNISMCTPPGTSVHDNEVRETGDHHPSRAARAFSVPQIQDKPAQNSLITTAVSHTARLSFTMLLPTLAVHVVFLALMCSTRWCSGTYSCPSIKLVLSCTVIPQTE